MRLDQLIGDHRMRLMAVVKAAPSVREGCRRAGIHHSTYYSWLRLVSDGGADALVPGRSRSRVKSAQRIRLESEIVAYALAHPQLGPRPLFAELSGSGVAVGSASQVWRVLRAHGLNRAGYRYRLMALARGLISADDALEPARCSRRWVGRLHAESPGDLVQFDCFQIGRLKEARRTSAKLPAMVWQYTAMNRPGFIGGSVC